jgi:hypothetical protein
MNSYRQLQVADLAQVPFLRLQDYAISRGWIRETIAGDSREAVFRSRNTEEAVVVPLTREFSDYAELVGDALYKFADQDEERTPQQLLGDLLQPPSDILRFRLEDPEAAGGTLPLEEGIELFSGGRRAILISAHSVIDPRTFYAQLSFTAADVFIRKCRLGQTEIGSYVAKFVCPIDASPEESPPQYSFFNQLPESFKPEPFARSVTRTVMQHVGYIADSIRMGDAQRLVSPSFDDMIAKKPVVSANLCDALLAMEPRGISSKLSLTASWSATRPIPSNAPSLVELPHDFFPVIKEVAFELRPKLEPLHDTFIGKVTALDRPDEDNGSGTVTIAILTNDGTVKARVKLSPAEYDMAVDAHKAKEYVEIHAKLVRGPRLNQLEDHSGFRRVPIAAPLL